MGRVNDAVSFTWIGHGTWLATSAGGQKVLLDCWITNNPVTPPELKNPDKVDIMALTHGHFDHIADAIEISGRYHPKVLGIPELVGWLQGKGVPGDDIVGFNKGGTVEVAGIKFTMVHAEHSCGITDNGQTVYGGEAVGYVIEFENGLKVYFSGDTDVFGDMRLIGELYEPTVAILPIGDWYTAGPRQAAKAVELLGGSLKTVLPMHFGTFPILTGRPGALRDLVGGGVEVVETEVGGTY